MYTYAPAVMYDGGGGDNAVGGKRFMYSVYARVRGGREEEMEGPTCESYQTNGS